MHRIPIRLVLTLSIPALLLAGCGGGGSIATGTNVTAKINWPQRSRDVTAPAAAQSFVVLIHDGAQLGGDVSIRGDRANNSAPHEQTYTSNTRARRGDLPYVMEFYAEKGAGGALVAQASGTLHVGDYAQMDSVSLEGTIKSLTIQPDQSIRVGSMKDFVVEPRGENGQLIAVSPGSIFWGIVAGGNCLEMVNGRFKGKNRGNAAVVAEVDGVMASTTDVRVVGTADPE